jgi:uroporphyrinogen-III synthase
VKPLVILRPEPGATATLARCRLAGVEAMSLPLFEVRSRAWKAPDPAGFAAIALTSANAVRLAGRELETLVRLPVWAVGDATAAAARAAGMTVAYTGDGDAAALFAAMMKGGISRAIWLAGEDRTLVTGPSPDLHILVTYASEPLPMSSADLPDRGVLLVHSIRAAERIAAVAKDHSRYDLAGLSDAVASAAGEGWATVTVARERTDEALVAAAIDRARTPPDKPRR